MSKTSRLMAAMALTSLFTPAAIAESPQTDVLVCEVEDLAEGDTIEAQILEVDYDQRTLTVRFGSDNELARLIVPRSAEIVQTGPNDLAERPMEFNDLHAGARIELEGVKVEGAIRLRIVGIDS